MKMIEQVLNILRMRNTKKSLNYFFKNPLNNVVGNETAEGAQSRFIKAVSDIIENNRAEEDIVIVTHGTVMSLFVSNYNKINTYELWKSLELPSFIELTIPDYKIINIMKTID